jgi:hypothetical protein
VTTELRAEIETALAALSEPERLRAQELIASLDLALDDAVKDAAREVYREQWLARQLVIQRRQ